MMRATRYVRDLQAQLSLLRAELTPEAPRATVRFACECSAVGEDSTCEQKQLRLSRQADKLLREKKERLHATR